MTGTEFLRRARRYAKRHGLEYDFVAWRGKGSHARIHLGSRSTTMKDRKAEIGKGLLRRMLSDLGINPREF